MLAIEREVVLNLRLFNNLLSLHAIRHRDKDSKKAVMAYCKI